MTIAYLPCFDHGTYPNHSNRENYGNQWMGGVYLIVFSDKPIWRSEIVGEVLRSYNIYIIYIDEIVGIGRSLRSFVLFVRSLFSTYCRPSR